ncbi:LAETG motif-containing sortase-dependent surface protein [Streptomyces sp. NPDC058572]|uniref:LAETG motif-containing sortase-dependent surface protein n=1 Tax=Streptomyces sp. NPDC058572 TaxID=3346546 RepID=UPI003652AA09
MAVAAATAVIAPATFLAAPAAYADPSPATSESATATADPAPSDTATTSPAPSDIATASPAPSDTATTTTSPSPSDTATTSPSPSDSATTSPSPSAEPTSIEDVCDDEKEPQFDENLQTALKGLPSKIVAGSGFHNFKLSVSNKGENSYKRVDLGVFAASIDEDITEDTSGYLTLQYKDPESGEWNNISLDENDEGAGYLGYTDVKAKESFSIDLRLSVDGKAPAGFGYAISIGVYADDKGNCVYSDDEAFYEFDILAAGSEPGDVDDAEPQEGGKTPVKPEGNTEINPQGNLAETGSDSQLPVIGAIGGITILAGAGVVFAMKRRKGNAAA